MGAGIALCEYLIRDGLPSFSSQPSGAVGPGELINTQMPTVKV